MGLTVESLLVHSFVGLIADKRTLFTKIQNFRWLQREKDEYLYF